VVLRFRRSRGVERQQLKWFTFAVALVILCQLATDYLFPNSHLGTVFFGLAVAFVPLAAGMAILRYRLYDIDRLINRTLVYGLLTALLGVVYTGCVFGLGQLLSPVSGESSLAVAGSTLVAAALFQPARHRIQAVVDRRFNRRRYDAASREARGPRRPSVSPYPFSADAEQIGGLSDRPGLVVIVAEQPRPGRRRLGPPSVVVPHARLLRRCLA
jgi:hypothetical protein